MIALIGYGAFGHFIAQALRTSGYVKLIAVVDQSAKGGQADGYAVTTDLNDVLANPKIQAVHIATPPHTHAELAQQALAAGKHCVIEKPLALSPEEGRNILAAAERAGRVVAVGHIMRYNPLINSIRQLIAGGAIGPARYVSVNNLAHGVPPNHWFWNLEQSGGILVEHGVHFIDAAAYLLNNEAITPSGELYMRGGRNTEARMTVRIGQTIASFWHGFIAADAALESTDWHIIAPQGHVRIAGWIPYHARLASPIMDSVHCSKSTTGRRKKKQAL
jgi:predicted dehydrogenase